MPNFNPTEKVHPVNVAEEMSKSFLDYSMSVIISRALPDARDGLKPSQRRILVTMNDLGVLPNRKHIKCAKIVGDTMGNYHPHGDQAIYPTLVHMAQPWAMGWTRARATDCPFGASASKVSQSPIQKSSWWYSAELQCAEVSVGAAGVATAGAMKAMPRAANTVRRCLSRSVAFMSLTILVSLLGGRSSDTRLMAQLLVKFGQLWTLRAP